MEPILRLRRVTKAYGRRPAVENLSLEVAPGESIAVLGPSGCGKTTVLRLIAGLERPDEGDIWIDGRQVASNGRNTVPAYERGVGLVFQDLALWPHLTVRDHVAFVLASTATPKHDRVKRIDDVLRVCRIDARHADRFPHELSGGEQQRVALARALVGTPRLLLLDEPFSSLDAELRGDLRHQVSDLHKALGVAMITVTHDPEDARILGQRVLRMLSGRLDAIV